MEILLCLQPNHPPPRAYVRVVIDACFMMEVRDAREVRLLFRQEEPEPLKQKAAERFDWGGVARKRMKG
jgi:hypothetical protein